MTIRHFLLFTLLLIAGNAYSLTAGDVKGIAIGETDARVEALNKALTSADEKTEAYLQAMLDDGVKVAGDKVFVVKDGKGYEPVTGSEVTVPDDAEDVINNNMMRGELEAALAGFKLFSKDEKTRRAGIKALQSESDESKLPLIEKAFAAEQNANSKTSWA